ncbi:hypothetical protein [Marinomonas sp. BSi20584]|uniref:hypothetical protein n=1 Tax=Marinomonas sp. BSi20584 TaxID=1594462 RepID=UPI000C1DE8C7|nr:hypothetical protein [Marinomonas sp. BSi20584]PJE54124.1 hypothetical protein TY87_17005 [Marinomonas sp. BSi20584]
MIVDIPSSEDFVSAGKAQFDFSWDIAISFIKLFDGAGEYYADVKEDEHEFWESAKQRIQTAIAIAQQGVELILKGKIIEISPYLLISGSPSDWPKNNTTIGVSFSEFRTIDAQDLIKVYNLFSEDQLSQDFVDKFNVLRKLRNQVMHTVDNTLKISALEVVVKILEMHETLFPSEYWVNTRNDFLIESPESLLFTSEGVEAQVAWEFYLVFSLLTRSQVTQFFAVDKRQRNYICPECAYQCEKFNEIEPKHALLNPNAPTSTELYCFVCGTNYAITRQACSDVSCKGNVISDEYLMCCSCGLAQ